VCATDSEEDAVLSRRCLHSKDTLETVVFRYTVKVAGQKQVVARPQLGDGNALASGSAASPVELWTDVSRESDRVFSLSKKRDEEKYSSES